jgi:hypothetical protein
VGEGYFTADGMDQAIGRLRSAVRHALGNMPPIDFVESWRPKHIRLSTQLGLIRMYPTLPKHPDPLICSLANRLVREPNS